MGIEVLFHGTDGGVIGGCRASRFLLHGIVVCVYDPHPQIQRRVREMFANTEKAWSRLTLVPTGSMGKLSFCSTIADAVREAEFIVDCSRKTKI